MTVGLGDSDLCDLSDFELIESSEREVMLMLVMEPSSSSCKSSLFCLLLASLCFKLFFGFTMITFLLLPIVFYFIAFTIDLPDP